LVVTKVLMPKLGLMMVEGRIIQWLKQEGETVQKGEPLFELETEKLTQVVDAWGSGVLRKILAEEGSIVPVSETIGIIAESDEELPTDIAQSTITDVSEAKKAEVVEDKGTRDERVRIRISPVARKLANVNNIDITTLVGSGPRGRIVKADVMRVIDEAQVSPQPVATDESIRYEPVSIMRKIIAERLLHSYLTAAHVSIMMDVDMAEVIKLRQELIPEIERKAGVRLSYTDIIVKVVARALRDHLIVNSTLKDDTIQIFNDINIAVAVALEQGLIVPVVREADKKSLTEISSILRQLVEKARNSNLSPDDVMGGTFTITNLGMLEVDAFAPIINPPQAAILGIGQIAEKPVVSDKQIVIRPMMTITLQFDHRILDGALAAQFLRTVKRIFEHPHLLNV
jgi:pyruvate dehydrogenase E2 component (dihydrolipoamide acetyltransferase)